MAHWLDKYIDYEVDILYLTDSTVYHDKGRLEDHGDGWLELTKSGETFLIPYTAIRLIKIVGPPATNSNKLVRPVDAPEEVQPEDKQRLIDR